MTRSSGADADPADADPADVADADVADADPDDADPADAAVALRLSIGRVARRLRRLFVDSGEGTAFLELAVLDRLQRSGPTSPGVLSSGEGVTSAAIAATLRELERRGLVARTGDPTDGRRVVVSITEQGSSELAGRDEAVTARLRRVLADELDDAEREVLPAMIRILEKVGERI